MNKINQISPSMLASIEKCKLKFVLDSNARTGKGHNYEFNPNSFMGELIHKVLENYFKEFYDLNEFDHKWEETILKYCEKIKIEKKYAQYWAPHYYPKKINTLKIIKNYQLLEGSKVLPEKKVIFKNIRGIIDLYEIADDKVRITDFKTGVIHDIEDGSNIGVKEAYIEQLKTYGYIIFKTEQVKAEYIELVIKGLGNNEMYSFRYSQLEYEAQGIKIDRLINETNKVIELGNIAVLATPEPSICNYCDHQFECNSFHNSIRTQPENWEKIVLLKTINVKFDYNELSINVLVNDRTTSIHNIPENDFVTIKKMNGLGKEVLLTKLFQVSNSRVKKWCKLTRFKEI